MKSETRTVGRRTSMEIYTVFQFDLQKNCSGWSCVMTGGTATVREIQDPIRIYVRIQVL